MCIYGSNLAKIGVKVRKLWLVRAFSDLWSCIGVNSYSWSLQSRKKFQVLGFHYSPIKKEAKFKVMKASIVPMVLRTKGIINRVPGSASTNEILKSPNSYRGQNFNNFVVSFPTSSYGMIQGRHPMFGGVDYWVVSDWFAFILGSNSNGMWQAQRMILDR